MFIRLFCVGFGAKAATPKISPATLFLAALLGDLRWPTLLLEGAERVRIAPGMRVKRIRGGSHTLPSKGDIRIGVCIWHFVFWPSPFLFRNNYRLFK